VGFASVGKERGGMCQGGEEPETPGGAAAEPGIGNGPPLNDDKSAGSTVGGGGRLIGAVDVDSMPPTILQQRATDVTTTRQRVSDALQRRGTAYHGMMYQSS
jgi:hypothetical protein